MPSAIVTGAAQGIGAATCVELLKRGYKVCVADVNEAKGAAFVAEQQKIFGEGNVFFTCCDVRKEEDFTRAFDETQILFQSVDVLVNDAGVANEKCPRDIIDVNLMGTIIGCKLALKYMGKSNGGKGGMVLNVSSLTGILPYWKRPAYSASKFGIIGLTRSYGCAQHAKNDGVIFAAICPGLTDVDRSDEESEVYSKRADSMSPVFVAQGVMKLIEDRINGSALVVTKSLGYRYVEFQDKIDNMLMA